MPSEQIENYLKNIYKLQSNEGKVTTTSLSKNLNISPASVSEMIKKLADEGTLMHTPYKGVELTAEGKKLALRIIRKHRLWEMFLVEILKFKWDEIDEEAERFEHIMSDKMEAKIDDVLGHPVIDPHGDPIPSKNGVIKHVAGILLSEAIEGSTVQVLRVNDAHSECLQFISSVGISLNKKITVKQKLAFDGSLSIKIGKKEQFISKHVADAIYVGQVKEQK
jgi:DtxR family transcriptional regulator, Mn-dependent transcriptional regulator